MRRHKSVNSQKSSFCAIDRAAEKRRLKCSIFPLEHLESIIIKKKAVYQSNLIEIKQLISLKCVDFVRVGGKFVVRVSANSHFASHRAVCEIYKLLIML